MMTGVQVKTENKKAIETKVCPRCGKPLHFRYVLTDRGNTSEEDFELYCLAGHSYNYNLNDFRKEAPNAATAPPSRT